MEKKGFLVYFDWLPMLEQLSDADRGRVLLKLYDFAQEVAERDVSLPEYLDQCDDLTPQTWIALGFMGSAVDRDTRKWCRTREAREAKKRGAARKKIDLERYYAHSPDESL